MPFLCFQIFKKKMSTLIASKKSICYMIGENDSLCLFPFNNKFYTRSCKVLLLPSYLQSPTFMEFDCEKRYLCISDMKRICIVETPRSENLRDILDENQYSYVFLEISFRKHLLQVVLSEHRMQVDPVHEVVSKVFFALCFGKQYNFDFFR